MHTDSLRIFLKGASFLALLTNVSTCWARDYAITPSLSPRSRSYKFPSAGQSPILQFDIGLRRLQGPTLTCPEVPPELEFCDGGAENQIAELNKGIEELQELLEKEKVVDDDSDVDEDLIRDLEKAICDLQDARSDIEDRIADVCGAQELVAQLITRLQTEDETCSDISFDASSQINTRNTLQIILFTIEGVLLVIDGLLAAAQSVDIPLIGATLVAPFLIAKKILEGSILVLKGVMFDFDRTIVDKSGNLAQCTLDTADATQDAVRETFQLLEQVQGIVNETHDAVRETFELLEQVQGTVNETNELVAFLSCPFTDEQQNNTVFIGQGCDGIDNNCNSIIGKGPAQKRVDECAEDQVPPSINLRNDIPALGFKSVEEAHIWFTDNIETSDDCVSVLKLEIGNATKYDGGSDPRLFQIIVRVFDPICEADIPLPSEKPGRFETKEVFLFIVDDIAPVIECGFGKRQDLFHVLDPDFIPNCTNVPPFPGGGRDDPLHITPESPLIDVKFWYHIKDEAPGDSKFPVTIKILSNELELRGRGAAEIVATQNLGEMGKVNEVHRAEVFLAPYTCHDGSDGSSICKVEMVGDPEFNTRFYDIEVTATDEIGNVGSATCSVIVIPKGHPGLEASRCGGMSAEEDTGRRLSKKHKHRAKNGKARKAGHDPNDLRREFALSKQRFQIANIELYFDTSLDTTRNQSTNRLSKGAKSGKSASHDKYGHIVDIQEDDSLPDNALITNTESSTHYDNLVAEDFLDISSSMPSNHGETLSPSTPDALPGSVSKPASHDGVDRGSGSAKSGKRHHRAHRGLETSPLVLIGGEKNGPELLVSGSGRTN